jgi:hypothetical protein
MYDIVFKRKSGTVRRDSLFQGPQVFSSQEEHAQLENWGKKVLS